MSNPYHSPDEWNPYPPGDHSRGTYPFPGYPVISPYPGAGVRLGALIIDHLVVGVIMSVIAVTVLWDDISSWINEVERWDGYGDATYPDMGGFYLVGVISVVVWFAYRVGMEVTRGQTLGKMALKIRVVDVDGALPTFGASFLRNSWYLISSVLSFIPFLGWIANLGIPVAMAVTISNHPYKQSFTDRWAKTYVVSTRPVF